MQPCNLTLYSTAQYSTLKIAELLSAGNAYLIAWPNIRDGRQRDDLPVSVLVYTVQHNIADRGQLDPIFGGGGGGG